MAGTLIRKLSGPLIRLDVKHAVTGLYDIELAELEHLRQYSSIDCHLVIYPYSRKVNARHINILPFEEYVADIISRHRSVYIKTTERGPYIFGVILALSLIAVFIKYRPVELISIESIVSAFGVYFVGKELWDDIGRILQSISHRWKLRYVEGYYPYQLAGQTTLSQYSGLAKVLRYGRRSLMPEKIDFIQQSNSQTVRMRFESEALKNFKDGEAHIASLHLEKGVSENFIKDGFLFGVKLSLNRKRWGVEQNLELFQSLDRGRPGCIDAGGSWRDGHIFYRRTWRLGNIKYFRSSGTIEGLMVEKVGGSSGKIIRQKRES
jgi:hypothetical protein